MNTDVIVVLSLMLGIIVFVILQTYINIKDIKYVKKKFYIRYKVYWTGNINDAKEYTDSYEVTISVDENLRGYRLTVSEGDSNIYRNYGGWSPIFQTSAPVEIIEQGEEIITDNKEK